MVESVSDNKPDEHAPSSVLDHDNHFFIEVNGKPVDVKNVMEWSKWFETADRNIEPPLDKCAKPIRTRLTCPMTLLCNTLRKSDSGIVSSHPFHHFQPY